MTDRDPPRPICVTPPDGVVIVRPGVALQYEGCWFPPGTSLRFYYQNGANPMDTDLPMPMDAEPKPLILQPSEPSAPALDPAQLQQIAGDNPMLAFALAAVAVLGGGAAWKHYGKASEQKHEQAMRALEIEAQKAQIPTTQPPPCQAANAQLEARLAALDARIGKAEQGFSLGGDLPDELEERLVKIERALKKAAK